jgi:MEMO1 family protein
VSSPLSWCWSSLSSSWPADQSRVLTSHAGYRYSGPCAAWAYKSLDLSKAKRVFVLGPSHTFYLEGCAITSFKEFATPLGNLTVDEATVATLRSKDEIPEIPRRNDMDEHSLEMHLPYLYKRLSETFASPAEFPTIVPLLVGSNDGPEEKEIGRLLAPYVRDPTNAFIISSDFCHWGRHFSYRPYSATADAASTLQRLGNSSPTPTGRPIHETIKALDQLAMDAIATGRHDAFVDAIDRTGNTVCGQHPIGVMMAALETLAAEDADGATAGKYKFEFVQYQRSNLVVSPQDYSVSYVSAYAIA